MDGVAKVTGAAKYTVEFAAKYVAYGFIVQSEIAKSAIKRIGTAEVEKQSDVIKNAVFHATGKRIRNLPITPDKLL